ncbi:MAG: SDR family oxidoreductase [Bacteroidetes bacterium]|nr:SDR family oxidoreductase [Bacteroidota bacterium]
MKKTIFITGASSGIGKATAKLFSSKGWSVIATMRTPEKDSGLRQLNNVEVVALDVSNAGQIENVVKAVTEKHKIDVVFNNAGYGLSGPIETLSDERIINQLNTNLLGVIRVTRAFVPHFKKQNSGLFINTTSMAGIVGFPFDSIYNASKWAVEGFTESLYYELHPYNIQVKTIAPGVVYTDFGLKNLDKSQLPEYEKLSKKFIEYMMGDMSKVSTPELIAESVFNTVTDGKDQIRYVAGVDANEMYAERLEKGKEGFRQNLSRILFE